jgi:sugar lactone lactonase YvrE
MRGEGDDLRILEDQYWDAVVRREIPAQAIDPAVAAAIARLHADDDATGPNPFFAKRLRDLVLAPNSQGPELSGRQLRVDPAVRKRHPLPDPRRRVAEPARWFGLSARATSLVAASILVAFVVGLLLGVPLGRWGSSGGQLSNIAAPQVTAVSSPASTSGQLQLLWETRGDPADPLGSAPFPEIAPDGTIWITDETADKIRIFSEDGALLDVWGGSGTGEGEFDFTPGTPVGRVLGSIAFDAAGNAFVLDPGNYRVQKFSPDRTFLTEWGGEGQSDGRFASPSDIAVTDSGQVIVVDDGRFRPGMKGEFTELIQVFDTDGRFLAKWGTVTVQANKFFSPLGVDVGPDRTLFFSDSADSTILRFTEDGKYLGMLGGFGREEGDFLKLKGVAIDDQGHIYCADWGGHRLTVLDREGRFLASWGEYGTEPGQFHFPYGLALDGKGNIYVTDDSGRLQKFRLPRLPETATPQE